MGIKNADPALRLGKDRKKIIAAIRDSKEFRSLANFQGIAIAQAFSSVAEMKREIGHLPVGELSLPARVQFEADRYNLKYVVYSYDTPIFWRTRSDVEQFVDDFFSNTTSKHQSVLREYWEKSTWEKESE